ncbi:hypothetical protein EVAR_97034_1 [Eumeta japonica]|uniref:Uncharacterized protein n=1 Tax=Eumeta variegata TaxID=151549 RepID=A0A4C1WNS2_EUMVA|nr:hypothetical protein EVAR_97034_1 [Eumeta japonica]
MTGCHTKSEICFMANSQSNNEYTKNRRSDASLKSKCSAEKSNDCDCGDEFLNIQNDADHGDDGHNTKVNNMDAKVKTDGFNKINLQIALKNNRSQLKLEESTVSLDSDVKAFKDSVQELLENFFRSVKDFECYKQKYNEIIQKHQENSLTEMEQFVKELLYHVMLGAELTEQSGKEIFLSSGSDQLRPSNESINVENYLLDNISVQHDINNSSVLYEKISSIWRKSSLFTTDDFSNLNLCCQSKVREMNVLSATDVVTSKGLDAVKRKRATSLDNMKRVASVTSQDTVEIDSADIPIPIKISHAKKDIRIDNECDCRESSENTKSFLAKVCGYICRIFRKDNDT